MRGIMYTQKREGLEERTMQMTVHTDEAWKHTHSKPCKHNANQISISTNPLFNHVYSAWVQSNNTENTIITLYTLLMWRIILHSVNQALKPVIQLQQKWDRGQTIITFQLVSLIESLQETKWHSLLISVSVLLDSWSGSWAFISCYFFIIFDFW